MAELINPLSGEKAELPDLPKRGRPAKNAPIYDDDRNIIITSEEHEAINEIVEDISRSVKKVETIFRNAAVNYCCLGSMLYKASCKATCVMTAARYEAKTGIPARMVSTAMKVYKKFGNNPEALEKLTMREVAMLIGEKKDAQDGGETSTVHYNLPEGQQNSFNEDFGMPTASGELLEKYRLHTDYESGRFFLLSKGSPAAIPMGSLVVDQPHSEAMKAAYRELMTETQCLLERYYALIEQEEKNGQEY